MLQGIKLLAHPTAKQKHILSQWMGCARVIWNAKCQDEKYMTQFARKYSPIGTYAPIDQTYSQYKNRELTPWLYACPSQILRNSAVNWYQTYWDFIKGECGKPRVKSKSSTASIYLTNELFKFVLCKDGNTRLFIGAKKNNIGFLSIKIHKHFKLPNSITIKRERGKYYVSFAYGKSTQTNMAFNRDNLKHLQKASTQWLTNHVVGIDRGVAIPAQTPELSYDFSCEQKKKVIATQKYLKRMQRKLAQQKKSSKRRTRTKQRIGNLHAKVANIRNDFCHKTSHSIVNSPKHKVIVIEDLATRNLSKSAKGTIEKPGKNVKAKSGLNRAILDKGWHKLETYLAYKSQRLGKAFFKVSARYTSQTCANCGHTHPANRQTQSNFVCLSCGHTDNADRNAAINIKQNAIRLIQNSGTELSKRGVLLDSGRGAKRKSMSATVNIAAGNEASKKKGKAAIPEIAA